MVWEKPVVVFYRERRETPERRALAVIKARQLVVSRVEAAAFRGDVIDFFPLMGDIDYLSTEEGASGRYVLCWFNDKEDDFSQAWRRLMGVTFPHGITFVVDKEGKRTYNAHFRAAKAKLNSQSR